MRKMILVLLCLIPLVACGVASPTNIVFTSDTTTVAVNGSVTLHWSSNAKSGCWIEPFIGSVPCNGSKVWPFAFAGTFTFTFHTPDAQSQSVVILVK